MFKELFDPVIEDRHGGYKPTDQHKTDLNAGNLQVYTLINYWSEAWVKLLVVVQTDCSGPVLSVSPCVD